MADVRNAARGEFQASIREVEPGVFRPEYRGELNTDHTDEREFPDYHVGTSIADVKLWTEQMARAMGHARVVWEALPEWPGTRS